MAVRVGIQIDLDPYQVLAARKLLRSQGLLLHDLVQLVWDRAWADAGCGLKAGEKRAVVNLRKLHEIRKRIAVDADALMPPVVVEVKPVVQQSQLTLWPLAQSA